MLQLAVRVTRNGASGPANVSWSVTGYGPSPISDDDIVSSSGYVYLAPGTSDADIFIIIRDDDEGEISESMILSLDDVQPSDTQRLDVNALEVRPTERNSYSVDSY